MASETDDSKQNAVSGLRIASPEPEREGVPAAPVPPPSRPPPRYGAGDVIASKYRLRRRLGEGGMGDVWLAHNETLDIDVAIKLIRGDLATPEMAERLLHEARAAARLGHPAIVRVNDFGNTGRGDPFLVMELLDGEDLSSALAARGRLTAVVAVRTLLPIAHALKVTHTKGIVHRDIKPENIFLAKSDDGKLQPKLVDFGVAKLEHAHVDRLTQSREVVGSPLYMSPEQARGDEVDHRADIWALAVVLYESITGRAPFEGKNYNAVLYSIIANPPTPSADLGVGDADLWTLLERGFRKEADERWFSMQDFGEALAHWLEDRGVHEDITGASLASSWFEWKKEDGLERPPSSDEGVRGSQLPPLPLPPEETRARVITIRKARPMSNRTLAVVAVSLLVFAITALILSTRRTPERHAEPAPLATVTAAMRPEPAASPATPEAVEHERAVEAALAADDVPPPSPSEAPQPAVAHPVLHAQKHTDALSHGIHISDPYAGAAQHPASTAKPTH